MNIEIAKEHNKVQCCESHTEIAQNRNYPFEVNNTNIRREMLAERGAF
jgi:hypothetical protein